jgi:plasmid maintenance system killer protein
MKVSFSNKKLKREIEDDAERIKRYGLVMAKKIKLRMDALKAANFLADFLPSYSGPERCHELKENLAGTFSMDVKQPYRLLFWPVNMPDDIDTVDEEKRWQAIKEVEIQKIEDTHG